jgi:hypothetical protein
VARLVQAVLPARMGTSFRWLVGSTWIGNLGDGMGLAAGPLLIASQTQDPLLVALAGLLQRLPWLLFGLYAGALAWTRCAARRWRATPGGRAGARASGVGR